MKQDDVIQPDVFSGLLNDAIGMNIQTLELFAGMYICEKLKQDLTAKAADILGHEIANKFCTSPHEPEENTPAAAEMETNAPTLSAKLQKRAKA